MASKICIDCRQQTAVPRVLPCDPTHALCPDCVKKMIKTAGRSDHLSCPKCKGLFSVTVRPKGREESRQYVKEKYKQEIKLAQNAGVIIMKGKIMGMTILSDNLFILCDAYPCVIFKYDLCANTKGPWKPVQLCIADMTCPCGIAASETSSCLYITDWHTMFGGRLWRYKYQKGQETEQEDPVAILDVQPFGVSVSQKTDEVLVTCATPTDLYHERGWIYIYKRGVPNFTKTRTIDLPDLGMPRHSILTSSSHTKFIVCHGWGLEKHGVTSYSYVQTGKATKISCYGNISGGGSGEQEVNRPLSMIQDEDGLILVVDYYNNRIQLMTEELQLVRHLIASGITYPRHVCLHSKFGRLYVGQEDGNVQIFDALLKNK